MTETVSKLNGNEITLEKLPNTEPLIIPLTFRVSARTFNKLSLFARIERRKLSDYTRNILVDFINQKGEAK